MDTSFNLLVPGCLVKWVWSKGRVVISGMWVSTLGHHNKTSSQQPIREQDPALWPIRGGQRLHIVTWGPGTWNVGNYRDTQGKCDECGTLNIPYPAVTGEQVSTYTLTQQPRSQPSSLSNSRVVTTARGIGTELWLIQSSWIVDAYFILILIIMGVHFCWSKGLAQCQTNILHALDF